jgi:hypothetical protein
MRLVRDASDTRGKRGVRSTRGARASQGVSGSIHVFSVTSFSRRLRFTNMKGHTATPASPPYAAMGLSILGCSSR